MILRRYSIIALVTLFFVIAAPVPASAADYRLWIGMPGRRLADQYYEWQRFHTNGDKVNMSFGVTGPAGSEVSGTLDLSETKGRMRIELINNDRCTATVSVATCHGPADSMFGLYLAMAPGSSPGYVGSAIYRTEGDSIRIPLYATLIGVSQKIEVNAVPSEGSIGDIVDVTVTIANPGPNPLLVWELMPDRSEDLELVGLKGCKAVVISGTETTCGSSKPVEPGAQTAANLQLRINSANTARNGCICSPIGNLFYNTGSGLSAYTSIFKPVNIKVTGLTPPQPKAKTSGATTGSEANETAPASLPENSPSAEPSPSSSGAPPSSTQTPQPVVAAKSSSTSLPALSAVVIATALAAAAAVTAYLRRRRKAASTEG